MTFLANLALGFSVLLKNPKSKEGRAFALVAFATAGWIVSLYLMIFSQLDTLLIGRITFVFGSSMLAALLWFVSEFPERNKRSALIRRLALVLGMFFFFLSLSPYMILSAEIRVSEGFAYIWGDFGKIYLAWFLFYIFTVGYTFVHAWLRVRKTSGIKRRQYRALALGLTLFYVPMVVTQIVLPAIGQFQWNSLGPVFSIFAVIFIAQSMLSYRVFNFRWVFKWGLIIPATVSTVVGFIAFGAFLLAPVISPTYSSLITAIILTIIYKPLFRFVDVFASRIVGRGSYVFDHAVLEISRLSREHLDLQKLHSRLGKHLNQFFHLERYAVFTFVPNETNIIGAHIRGFGKGLEAVVPDFVKASSEYDMGIVERDELIWRIKYQADPSHIKRDKRMSELLTRWKVDMVVPLTIKKRLVGLLLLGPKTSKEPHGNEDRRLIEVIAGMVTPTFANAARFEAMKLLYEQLQEADKIKGEFIDVVSHQFRTPLTSIMWDVELALDAKPRPVSVRNGLANIHQRANFLRTVLYQMFDLLELENNKMQFMDEVVDLSPLIEEVSSRNKSYCKENDVCVETDLVPMKVRADKRHLFSAVEAIVENACDYSKRGETVTVKTELDHENEMAVIYVRDKGISMDKTTMKHMFKKFYRGKAAKKMSPNGTGIALFLAQEFLRRMNGSISVVSKVGKGTEFTLKIPLALRD